MPAPKIKHKQSNSCFSAALCFLTTFIVLNILLSCQHSGLPEENKPQPTWYRTLPPNNPEHGDEWIAYIDSSGTIQLIMIWVEKGTFLMGSTQDESIKTDEKPMHVVNIKNGFWMGKYEITQLQWEEIMGNWSFDNEGANHPAEMLSWYDAKEFISLLNFNETYEFWRLPSESEWEYACRAGTTTRYFWGDSLKQIDDYLWYYGNCNDNSQEVGKKKPNNWVFFDICGNVWEYCDDLWHENYVGAPDDGSSWIDNPSRPSPVMRGGWWGNSTGVFRSAYRHTSSPVGIANAFGFRIVRSANNNIQ